MATATLHPRLALLRALVATQGGEWTPARVDQAYAAHGYDAPKGTTHSHDLRALHRMGLLDIHETTGRRCYVPSRQAATNSTRGKQ